MRSKKTNIVFSNTSENKSIPSPVPSDKMIPDWYKKQNSYVSYSNFERKPMLGLGTTATVKKCMPVFDSITSGYFILTPCDIFIEQVDGQPYYQWSHNGFVDFHDKEQANEHFLKQQSIGKIKNPWGITTPKGYSSLFVPPMHHDNVINIFPGIVDTDSFNSPVFFPFYLKPGFSGMIDAGTPYAQVFPFKRDEWTHSLEDSESEKQKQQLNKITTVFYDGYKKFFWNKKSYV